MEKTEDSSSYLSQVNLLRTSMVCAGVAFFVCAAHITGVNRGKTQLCPPQMQLRQAVASRERLLEITKENNTGLAYLTSANILFMTMAKGGSTSTWNWLFLGTKGREYNRGECRTYVQNVNSRCWGTEAAELFRLPPEKRISILTSKETLRVAIQRNPMSRIISSYRSKFACKNFHNPNDFYDKTDANDRPRMVQELRRHAGFPEGAPCMNISEFASALEAARHNAGKPGQVLTSLSKLNPHIRPQEFYFNEIDYDIVLDTTDLQHTEYLEPIIERLKYKALIKSGIAHAHSTIKSKLMIPDEAAEFLHQFALQSKTGKPKLFTGK